MRPLLWSSLLVLGLTSALQASATGITPITDIKITACSEDNCIVPGYRKISQDLNKFSRGSFVHLHFTDQSTLGNDLKELKPITNIAVLQGQGAEMGPSWERIEGNLNDGNHGPILTMFVQRDPEDSPIDSIVVKYGYDSHAAIGYDRLAMDLNVGTGGQWVHLYYRKEGPRPPITHITTKACPLPRCSMDDSWTRINRPILTGTLKRYLYIFYKSVPGERPITSLNLSLRQQQDSNDNEDDGVTSESIDTGIRFKNNNIYLNYRRGELGNRKDALDNIAVELGMNPIPYGWNLASFDRTPDEEAPDWNAQIIYRTGEKTLPKVPALKFKNDGSFKIVQFADIHMATGPHSCYNAPSTMACIGDINTSEMMERVLEAERPDLVVFTGDNVNGMTSNDAYSTILKYSKPVVERGIPWTIIFGNHDEEGDLSREEMMRSVQNVPFSIAERGPTGISGTGNFVLQIHRRDRRPRRGRRPNFDSQNASDDDIEEIDEDIEIFDKRDARFTLYFLDSGAYSFNLAYPGYDWIKEDQVEWFRQTSQAITSQHPKDKIPNALAFFHIPIPEYALIDDDDNDDNGDDGDDDGDDDDKGNSRKMKRQGEKMVGDKVEGVSSPSYNSGMFEAIFESKDVRATTAGHDHLNDYCLEHRGIELCFGGGLGYGSYGRSSIYRRSRVFEILKNGNRVDTWKRLDDDQLTIVGQQTLFEGSKVRGDSSTSRGSPKNRSGRSQKGQRQRQTDDLLERLRQGAQFFIGGIKGDL